MSVTEDTHIVNENHDIVRHMLARGYSTSATDPPLQRMLAMSYLVAQQHKMAVSAEKGYPYITYGAREDSAYVGRMLTKIGRWYKNCVDPAAPDHLIGNYTDHLFGIAKTSGFVLDGENTVVELLSGDAITEAFRNEIGGHSCMTDGKAHLTEFYALNPEVVSLAVLNNKVRALVWRTTCGKTLMDRVYPNSGFQNRVLRAWALQQGYYVRSHDSLPQSDQIFSNAAGDVISQAAVAFERYQPQHAFPYMDSFSFKTPELNDQTVWLRSKGPTACHVLCGTAGGPLYTGASRRRLDPPLTDAPYCSCAWCDGAIMDEDDVYHISTSDDNICEDCLDSHSFTCQNCGDRCHDDDMRTVNSYAWCDNCAEDNSTCCEHCDEYVSDDRIIATEDNVSLCISCAPDYRCGDCGLHTYRGDCECQHVEEQPTEEGENGAGSEAGAAAAGTDADHQDVVRG